MKLHPIKDTTALSQQESPKSKTVSKNKSNAGTETRKDPRAGYAEPQLTKANFNKGRNPRKK